MNSRLVTLPAIAALSLGTTLILTSDRARSSRSTANPQPRDNPATNHISLSLTETATGSLPQWGIRLGDSKGFSMPRSDHGFTLSNPVPLHLDRQADHQPLQPGVYQTYPYSIILGVPRGGMDDGILGESPGNHSRMPIIRPHLKAIPRS